MYASKPCHLPPCRNHWGINLWPCSMAIASPLHNIANSDIAINRWHSLRHLDDFWDDTNEDAEFICGKIWESNFVNPTKEWDKMWHWKYYAMNIPLWLALDNILWSITCAQRVLTVTWYTYTHIHTYIWTLLQLIADPVTSSIRRQYTDDTLHLTHLPLVPYICIRESGQHWFR